jgi:hypothetical protein
VFSPLPPPPPSPLSFPQEYQGTVLSFSDNTAIGALDVYHVVYEDATEETLHLHELKQLLMQKNSPNAKSPSGKDQCLKRSADAAGIGGPGAAEGAEDGPKLEGPGARPARQQRARTDNFKSAASGAPRNPMIGKTIEKEFNGEYFKGKVISHESTGKGPNEALYHVVYEDNDEEDLDGVELLQLVAKADEREARKAANLKVRLQCGVCSAAALVRRVVTHEAN